MAKVLRRGEHPQRMSRRRRIDDHDRIRMLLGQLTDARPGHDLVHSGKRKLEEAAQLFTIEVGPAVADLEEAAQIRIEKTAVERGGVERLYDELRIREEVAEVGSGIGGEEHDLTRLRVMQGREAGDRRFSDATLAAEENDPAIRKRVERGRERGHWP